MDANIPTDRKELLDEKERLEAELAAIERVLNAMDVIDEYRASRNGDDQQGLLPTEEFTGLGTTDLLRAVLASNRTRWWDLSEILTAAERGGNDLNDRLPDPRNNLGVTASKLAERDAIQRRKEPGAKVQYRFSADMG